MGNMCTGKSKEAKAPKECRRLHENELQMLLESTNYTREEIIEWHNGFIKDNPEGKMKKKDFANAYKKFFGSGKPDSFCDHVFRVFDADGNGFIDFKEFLVAVSITSTNRNLKKKLKWIFTMYDIDGNGTIDRNEFRTIIISIFKILDPSSSKKKNDRERDAYIEHLFTKIDRDKSNLITQQEFIDACIRDRVLLELLAPSV